MSALPSNAGTSRTTMLAGPLRSMTMPSDFSSALRASTKSASPLATSSGTGTNNPLALHVTLEELRLHAFIGDALVRGMHVDDHQTVGVLSKHVDAVQLRHCVAHRRHLPFVDRWGRDVVASARFSNLATLLME